MIFKKRDQPLEVIIGIESTVAGNLTTTGVARIDGCVEGSIRADWLIIGDSGTVKGDVIARGTMVAGKIEGNIRSDEIVEIKAKGIVEGDIYTTKLSISEGACFDGRSFMRRTHELESRELLSLEKGGKKSLGAASAFDGFDGT
jgi:cytoskeletal protein CcmA (bactofilin family)